MTSGSVILYCADGKIVSGLIGSDGSYSIPNASRGTIRATVRSHSRTPAGFSLKSKLPPSIDAPAPPSGMGSGREIIPAVPERYGVPEESGLALAVDQQQVRFDIALTR